MTRFASIDFATLPPPDVVETLDYEAIYAARIARFLELWNAERVRNPDLPAYDSLGLQTDPIAVVLQESAYREALLRARINDAARAVMLPYSRSADLDNLAALFGVVRATDETDDRFRRRVQLAPEAFSAAGTVGGYIFHALTAAPSLLDVSVRKTSPGRVEVTCMSADASRVPTEAVLDAVRERLSDDGVKPLTDVVRVRPPRVVDVRIDATVVMERGPGQADVVARARAALDATLAGAASLGGSLYRSAILAALHQASVRTVALTSPADDVLLDLTSCFRVAETDLKVTTL